jgi:prophage tail gpP-like protein
MSKSHKVGSGETLGEISIKYYGVFGKWTKIRDGNSQLSGRKKATDGSPLIYPGDILIIPDTDEKAPDKIDGTATELSKNGDVDFALLVGGKLFSGFTGFSLSFPVDSLDTFSFSAPFDDSVADFREAFRPFTYKKCAVYYKKKIVFTGKLLTPNPDVSEESKSINLKGYPLCGILDDSALPVSKYPPGYSGMTLESIANDAAGAFGLSVVVKNDNGSIFKKVAYEPEDKVLPFLTKLGEQHGLIFTNNSEGNLLFWKAGSSSVVATFKEGELPFVSCTPDFDPQNFFSHITGFSKTEKDKKSKSYTYENKYLTKRGVLRQFSFVADDTESSDLESAVKAKAGRMFGSAVVYKLVVEGVEDKYGNLFAKNTLVAVVSPGAMIYRETKLLVKQADIKRNDKDGRVTEFTLVLPGSYNGTLPEDFPWEE